MNIEVPTLVADKPMSSGVIYSEDILMGIMKDVVGHIGTYNDAHAFQVTSARVQSNTLFLTCNVFSRYLIQELTSGSKYSIKVLGNAGLDANKHVTSYKFESCVMELE